MAQIRNWSLVGVVASLGLLMVCGGCTGCEQRVFDSVDQWLRDQPQRPGKVGTLVALDVTQTSRSVARRRMKRGDAPCDIGWRLDEAFAVDFEVEISVKHNAWTRHWTEEGSWRRDGDGRWMIESNVEFDGADGLGGERLHRVFSDEEGFWQWLGPELAARHERDAPTAKYWKEEFGGRFSGLMTLVSPSWERAGDDREYWVPGGQRRLCGPIDRTAGAQAWRSIKGVRSTLRRAQMRGEQGEHGGECRILEADYQLQTGAQMAIRLRECRTEPPVDRLARPEFERLVEVGRNERQSKLTNHLDRWVEEGLIIEQ